MNFFVFSALINLISSLLIGGFVLYKNKNKQINRHFFYFCFAVAFWSLGYIFWQISDNYNNAIYWLKFLMFGASYTTLFYCTFVIYFLNLEKIRLYKFFIRLGYVIFTVFSLITVFTNYIVGGVSLKMYFQYWPYAGLLMIPFLLIWFSYIVIPSYLLVVFYKKIQNPVKIMQIKYILLGIILAFIGGSTNYFLWFNIPIPPFANILVTVYTILIGYAIVSYNLMDIKIVIKKGLIYGLLVTVVWGLAAILLNLLGNFLSHQWEQSQLAITILIAFVIAIIFQPLRRIIYRLVNKINFFQQYDQEELKGGMKNLLEIGNLAEIGADIEKEVGSAVNASAVKLLIRQDNDNFIQVSDLEELLSCNFSDYLISYMNNNQEILARDELKNHSDKKFIRLADELKVNDIQVLCPLVINNVLRAAIVIGDSKDHNSYSSEEIKILDNLGKEIENRLWAMWLYKMSMDRIKQFSGGEIKEIK